MTNAKHINVQHLMYLVALVSERHVTRAAHRMGIGQPAMSTALARLRVLFNDPLLIKTTSGMEPTPRALELARRAQDAIELLSGAERTADSFVPATATGHFRLMASEGVSALLLPPFMERVRASAPHLRITVSAGDIRRTAEYLRDGEMDLILGFIQEAAPDLRQTLLYPEQLVCIASQAHKTIQGKVSLKQFVNESHAIWGAPPVPYPTLEIMVEKALEQKNLHRDAALHLSSMMSSAAIVATTDLLAVVPEHLAITAAQTLPLQILALPFAVDQVDISMLWHERWHRAPAHAWLRAVLRDVAKSLQSKTHQPSH